MEEESTEPEAVSSVLIQEVTVVVSSSSVYPISFRAMLPTSVILRAPIATPYAVWIVFCSRDSWLLFSYESLIPVVAIFPHTLKNLFSLIILLVFLYGDEQLVWSQQMMF